MYSIVCNQHEKSGNQVCGLNALTGLIMGFAEQNNLSEKEIVDLTHKICSQISTNEVQIKYNYDKRELDIS